MRGECTGKAFITMSGMAQTLGKQAVSFCYFYCLLPGWAGLAQTLPRAWLSGATGQQARPLWSSYHGCWPWAIGLAELDPLYPLPARRKDCVFL